MQDRYDEIFQGAGFDHLTGVDWRWLKAIAMAESSMQPDAVSPVGAIGLMQLMPGTAGEMAQRLRLAGEIDLFDPATNINLGAAYFQRCWAMWKKEDGLERVRFALGSYNAGPGNILRAQRLAKARGFAPNCWLSIKYELVMVTGHHAVETCDYVDRVERNHLQLIREKTSDNTFADEEINT